MTIWFSIPLIGFGQVKSDADPLDQNEKDSSIKVTKQHDKSGNLIQYDSIYIGPGKKYRIKFAKNDFIPSPMYILPPHYGNGIEDFELFNLDTIDYVPEFNSIGDQWDMWPPDIYGQPKLDSVFGELTSKDFKKMLEMEIDILQNGSSLDSLMIRVNEHLNTMEFNMKPLPKSDNDNSFQFFSSPINNDELDSMMQKQFQKMEEYIKRLENLLREHDLSSKEEIS
ncbi:MAG: hypothetical protein OXC92_08625 [Flavobacteriaceae bacterium]|nr:hypothetical protein [Flavobacteriaceae bacterium]MCY4217030.1 hypothetical protein [Flavobacteriaceae bacterium]MCY4253671.1 hypothetical protein [Flavobacteriaceae bacterium]